MPKVNDEKLKKINFEDYKWNSETNNSGSKFPQQFILNS